MSTTKNLKGCYVILEVGHETKEIALSHTDVIVIETMTYFTVAAAAVSKGARHTC